jgi:hypothetical protein
VKEVVYTTRERQRETAGGIGERVNDRGGVHHQRERKEGL